MTATYTPIPMMTLAALAANAPDARPSGETTAQHEERILAGINVLLGEMMPDWQGVWGALSNDGANFAYLAYNQGANAVAVVIRGTIFTPIDLLEDLQVGALVPFTPVPPNLFPAPILVSQGAMVAFNETVSMISSVAKTNLIGALATYQVPTVYVTGHSLGGCIASMVALTLATGGLLSWSPSIVAYTFAAPTAGLQAFADCYDQYVTTGSGNAAWRVHNGYDIVPNAWASLAEAEGFFPTPPGPAANDVAKGLINQFAQSTNANPYVQTNQRSTETAIRLNPHYTHYDAQATCETVGDFLAQIAYQHANSTYLQALHSHIHLPALTPIVTGLSQNSGPSGSGTTLHVRGRNFRNNSVLDKTEVDIGVMRAQVFWESDRELKVTVPPGIGVADIRVTTIFGTSAVTAADQFAWLPGDTPPPLAVFGVGPFLETGLLPNGGPVGNTNPPLKITITGSGFLTGSHVKFGEVRSPSVTYVSPTQMIAEVPPVSEPATVQVKVINPADQQSAISGHSAYHYGAPLLTALQPCCIAPGTRTTDSITISGSGFGETQGTVTFNGTVATVLQNGWSDGTIQVYAPPSGSIFQTTVQVVVTPADGPPSGLTSACVFTYASNY